MSRREDGFTIIELLVVMLLFSVVVLGLYSVLFSTRDGSVTAQNVSRVSQEARLGFNRIIRDTREAAEITSATATSYSMNVDFDGDQAFDADEFESITYAYDAVGDRITISNGSITETLIDGVLPIAGRDIFSYTSNLLEYDANADGVTTFTELNTARASGASLLTDNLLYVSHVSYAFSISSGDSVSEFFTQAQVRNARGG
jgi:prepilin-type N-terminal cleavage/methylation domain-containing protein